MGTYIGIEINGLSSLASKVVIMQDCGFLQVDIFPDLAVIYMYYRTRSFLRPTLSLVLLYRLGPPCPCTMIVASRLPGPCFTELRQEMVEVEVYVCP